VVEVAFPRLVIAAPYGRSGKTTVSIGLCAALRERGLQVQPFKKGPDYIDPSWLSEAAGRPCRNLDPWMLDDEQLLSAFAHGARGADVAIVEGNHGLYDGIAAAEAGDEDEEGSTAAVARLLAAPVVLVVDTARMGRSVAALIQGYVGFEPGTQIAGVILNNVAQARHEARLRQAIERHCHLPVLGAIPRRAALTIPDRHLGLVPRDEDATLLPTIAHARDVVAESCDLDVILALARAAPPLAAPSQSAPDAPPTCRIGVIRDRAFTFYYPENLEALEGAGAQLVPVDALSGERLPEVDALYIGGGFPEVFMDDLAANSGLRADLHDAAQAGLPIYAECGGLMYLSRSLSWQGRHRPMVGVLPCDVEVVERPQGHGYVAGKVITDSPFFPVGTCLRGHEYHHSRVYAMDEGMTFAFRLSRGKGLGNGLDGIVQGNVLAAYTHLHAAGVPGWAGAMVAAASSAR
jgi:cobyrinic acid a,c-diamide synthase